jgi:ribosome-binding protein aMBF1 (putative translation factor)
MEPYPRRTETLVEQLRAAIRTARDENDNKLSHYKLGKEAAVDARVIDRFMDGGDIRLDTAGRLARVLELELTRRRTRGSAKGRRPASWSR